MSEQCLGVHRSAGSRAWRKKFTAQFALDVGRHVGIGAVNQAFSVISRLSQLKEEQASCCPRTKLSVWRSHYNGSRLDRVSPERHIAC